VQSWDVPERCRDRMASREGRAAARVSWRVLRQELGRRARPGAEHRARDAPAPPWPRASCSYDEACISGGGLESLLQPADPHGHTIRSMTLSSVTVKEGPPGADPTVCVEVRTIAWDCPDTHRRRIDRRGCCVGNGVQRTSRVTDGLKGTEVSSCGSDCTNRDDDDDNRPAHDNDRTASPNHHSATRGAHAASSPHSSGPSHRLGMHGRARLPPSARQPSIRP